MKPPNHGLLHRVTVRLDDDPRWPTAEFEGYLTLDHPGGQFAGLKLLMPEGGALLIDATDRIEVLR